MKSKKLLAIVLAIAMIVSLLPASVVAADPVFSITFEIYRFNHDEDTASIEDMRAADVRYGGFKAHATLLDVNNDTVQAGDILWILPKYSGLNDPNVAPYGLASSSINLSYDYTLLHPTKVSIASASAPATSITQTNTKLAIMKDRATSDGYGASGSDVPVSGNMRAQIFGISSSSTHTADTIMSQDDGMNYLGLFEFEVVGTGDIALSVLSEDLLSESQRSTLVGFSDTSYTNMGTGHPYSEMIRDGVLADWPSVTIQSVLPAMDKPADANVTITDTSDTTKAQKTVTIAADEKNTPAEGQDGGTLKEGTVYTVYAPNPDPDTVATTPYIAIGSHTVTNAEATGTDPVVFTVDPPADTEANYNDIVAALNKGGDYRVVASDPTHSESDPVVVTGVAARQNWIKTGADAKSDVVKIQDTSTPPVDKDPEIVVDATTVDSTTTQYLPVTARVAVTYDPDTGYENNDPRAVVALDAAKWAIVTGDTSQPNTTVTIKTGLGAGTSDSGNTTLVANTDKAVLISDANFATYEVQTTATVSPVKAISTDPLPVGAALLSDYPVTGDDTNGYAVTNPDGLIPSLAETVTANLNNSAKIQADILSWNNTPVSVTKKPGTGGAGEPAQVYVVEFSGPIGFKAGSTSPDAATYAGLDFNNVNATQYVELMSALPGIPVVDEEATVKIFTTNGTLDTTNSKARVYWLNEGTAETPIYVDIQNGDQIKVYDAATDGTVLGTYTAKGTFDNETGKTTYYVDIPGNVLVGGTGEDTVVYLAAVHGSLESATRTAVPLLSYYATSENIKIVNAAGSDTSTKTTITIDKLINGDTTQGAKEKTFANADETMKVNINKMQVFLYADNAGVASENAFGGLTNPLTAASGHLSLNGTSLVISLDNTIFSENGGEKFHLSVKEDPDYLESKTVNLEAPNSASEITDVTPPDPEDIPPDDPSDPDDIHDHIESGATVVLDNPIYVLEGTTEEQLDAILTGYGFRGKNILVNIDPAIDGKSVYEIPVTGWSGLSTVQHKGTGDTWTTTGIPDEGLAVGEYRVELTFGTLPTNVRFSDSADKNLYITAVKAPTITLNNGNATADDVTAFGASGTVEDLGVTASSVFVYYQYGFVDPGYTVTGSDGQAVADPSANMKIYYRVMPDDPNAAWTDENAGTLIDLTALTDGVYTQFTIDNTTETSKMYQIRYEYTDPNFASGTVVGEVIRNVYVVYKLGDVFIDGVVDFSDASRLNQHALGISALAAATEGDASYDALYVAKTADVFADGTVDFSDASRLNQHALGISTLSLLYASDETSGTMTFAQP